ncbi:hypothetical protein AMJ39_04040 [candidate division TA06 bacterium DG_24]|jgi:magnesium transporter|uniref:Magnesium transporter MgtE n=3 Tax=Bacteria division TA06 TaxID=1156500 RepID=A0A0S8JMH6_UNCT6|nr:MAG: hypothetical protein AMJ39_04040 [candidate division TA06 bacterium DG_24]KPK70647.1 MAG: hypothetical protein AMJ82_02545 [candidate division TA06 bacterium SM23_40]KPL10937.1 MAG: hypothetical protein AMJ71_01305 [candidate division TA06 bacterium SM1_40]
MKPSPPLDELIEQAADLIRDNKKEELRALATDLHPADIALIIDHLDNEGKEVLFAQLSVERAADVLLEIDQDSLSYFLDRLSHGQISRLIDEMELDDATDIVAELEPEERVRVFDLLSDEESKELEELLRYDEAAAGGIMSPECIALPADLSVAEALDRLRDPLLEDALVFYLYIVDKTRRLRGVLTLRDLIIAPPDEQLASIMVADPIAVQIDEDQEEVARTVAKYDLIEVPVIDRRGKLRGIITVDDIVDVLEEEATEDMMGLGGIGETEHAFSPTRKSVGRRLPWLAINLITAFLAATVVALFQDTIKAVVTLAVFMPIVAGMGGNAGTQAVTIIVRAIALGEVTVADTWRLLAKEAAVGALMGLVIGTLTGVVAFLWVGNAVLGIVVGLALIANLLFAGVVGASVPLFFRWINLDPALASGILLTTVTDVIGFFIFLGLATILLRYL